MKILIPLAVAGAAAFIAVPAAQAAGTPSPGLSHANAATDAATDMSAQRRYRVARRYYAPRYHRSYGYARSPYYSSGPSVSFSFGGGPRYGGYGGYGPSYYGW